MPARTDTFDLGPLRLRAGEARQLDLEVELRDLDLGTDRYEVRPSPAALRLDVTKMLGGGISLRLRLRASVGGPCMRCLEPASPSFHLDVWEIDQPGEGEDLDSPYVQGEVVDLTAWANDTLALALPQQILCRAGCLGLCPECGVDLNTAEPGHAHEKAPDPRWAALRELKLDG